MSKNKGNVFAIGIMFFLFAMISFVTGLQNPMALIAKSQFGATNAMAQLGNLANFIAYAFMGLPAGLLLKKKGYKFTALAAVAVGFTGVAISYLSGIVASFPVYLLGAFVSGFSMCMLNTVVNPMLNTLGGGGNKGNQLIQLAGACNSLSATIVPYFAGMLIGEITEKTQVADVNPALFIAMGVFAAAFVILLVSRIPEPELGEEAAEPMTVGQSIKGALSYKNLLFGVIAIFMYVGVEVGIPNTLNNYLTTKSVEQLKAENVALQDSLATLVCPQVETVCAEAPATEAVAAETAAEEKPVAETKCEPSACANCPKTDCAEAVCPDEVAPTAPCGAAKCPETPAEDPTCVKIHAVKEKIEANQKKIEDESYVEGMGVAAETAGAIVGLYWFLMLIGRLIGGAVGSKVSSRAMITGVASLAVVLLVAGMYLPTDITVVLSEQVVPVGAALFVLCGLCTSVMWGAIFNLAVEGLGKYTSIASGLFMVMVCGGGVLPFLQGYVADSTSFMTSFWVPVAGLLFILWYALLGSKVKKQ